MSYPFKTLTQSAIDTLRRLNELSDDELKALVDAHTPSPDDLGQLVARAIIDLDQLGRKLYDGE